MEGDFGEGFAGLWTQHVPLLIFLESTGVYNSLNLGQHWQRSSNTTSLFLCPTICLCPSDSPPATLDGFFSYHASAGSGRWHLGFDAPCDGIAVADGLFVGYSPTRPADCTDGLSHTSAFSEQVHGGTLKLSGPASWKHPSLGLIYLLDPSPPTQAELMSTCDHSDSLASVALNITMAGSHWFSGYTYTHLFLPGKPSCYGATQGTWYSPMNASSRHLGGVNLLHADGSVRFITNDVDLEAWRALGSRNGQDFADAF